MRNEKWREQKLLVSERGKTLFSHNMEQPHGAHLYSNMEWRVAGCEGVDERGEKTHLEKPVKARGRVSPCVLVFLCPVLLLYQPH